MWSCASVSAFPARWSGHCNPCAHRRCHTRSDRGVKLAAVRHADERHCRAVRGRQAMRTRLCTEWVEGCGATSMALKWESRQFYGYAAADREVKSQKPMTIAHFPLRYPKPALPATCALWLRTPTAPRTSDTKFRLRAASELITCSRVAQARLPNCGVWRLSVQMEP